MDLETLKTGSSELTLWKIPQAPSLSSNALKLININLTKTQSLSIQALQAWVVDSFA